MSDTQHTTMILALIYQQVATMEGMKAANQERINHGYALEYGDDAFQQVADELGRLAETLR